MSQSVPRINYIKMVWLLIFLPDDREKRGSSDVISTDGRRRSLTFFGLQVLFAAAITLAACAFLAAGSASGDNHNLNYAENSGRVITVQRLFEPSNFSTSDYNDH